MRNVNYGILHEYHLNIANVCPICSISLALNASFSRLFSVDFWYIQWKKSQCFNQLNFIVCDKWQWKKLLHLLSFKHSKCEARRPPKTSIKNWNLIAFLMSWLMWGAIIADHFSELTINTVKACLLTRNWTPLIGFKVFYCLRRRPSWSASERCANVTLWPSFV